MSRIRQTLMLQTSLSTVPLNFTLQATIPSHMLSLCAATLPRPTWEPLLYYAAVLAMGFLLFCVLVASYFDADQISVTDLLRRRAEMSQAAAAHEKGRVFDLRTITSGLRPSVSPEMSDRVKNGQTFVGITSSSGSVKSRASVGELPTNGHVVSLAKLTSGDGAPRDGRSSTNGLVRRFFAGNSSTAAPKTTSEAESAALDSSSGKAVKSLSASATVVNGSGSTTGSVLRKLLWCAHLPVCAVGQVKSFVCSMWFRALALRRDSASASDGGTAASSSSSSSSSTCFDVNQQSNDGESELPGAAAKTDARLNSTQVRKTEKPASSSAAEDGAGSKNRELLTY
jgi:hypothetical protein